jgi:hypothetical protein
MLTIFTIPKSFVGHIGVIQRNALRSWMCLIPPDQLFLVGDDQGVAEIAREYGVQHLPEVIKNEFGTPVLDSAFDLVQAKASSELILYINADIMLFDDIMVAIRYVMEKRLPEFLMVGRRWDFDQKELIGFSPQWQDTLLAKIRREGKLHGYSGIDFFLIPRSFRHQLPAFAVGRPGWDNWFILNTLKRGIPVIDATEMVTAVHQNHPAVYTSKMVESKRNITLAGGTGNFANLMVANWILINGELRRPPVSRRILSWLYLTPPVRYALAIKRRLRLILLS